jgi:hypothetical protein
MNIMSISCETVRTELSDYVEGIVSTERRSAIEEHFAGCDHCKRLRDGVQDVAQLARDPRIFQPPVGFSDRMRQHVLLNARQPTVPLGITDDKASAGDHIAYFWENDQDFQRGLQFLEIGLRGRDHCCIFGHERANLKALALLNAHGFDVDALMRSGRLSVLEGSSSGDDMLARIGADFQRALQHGAPVIRLLGNIGWGRSGWPDDDEILRFEARVTSAARKFPCVIVCMYDVRAVSGRILLRGAFQTHPLTISEDLLRKNLEYVDEEQFLDRLGPTRVKATQ